MLAWPDCAIALLLVDAAWEFELKEKPPGTADVDVVLTLPNSDELWLAPNENVVASDCVPNIGAAVDACCAPNNNPFDWLPWVDALNIDPVLTFWVDAPKTGMLELEVWETALNNVPFPLPSKEGAEGNSVPVVLELWDGIPKVGTMLLLPWVELPNKEGVWVLDGVVKSWLEALSWPAPNWGCEPNGTEVFGFPNKLGVTEEAVTFVPNASWTFVDGLWNIDVDASPLCLPTDKEPAIAIPTFGDWEDTFEPKEKVLREPPADLMVSNLKPLWRAVALPEETPFVVFAAFAFTPKLTAANVVLDEAWVDEAGVVPKLNPPDFVPVLNVDEFDIVRDVSVVLPIVGCFCADDVPNWNPILGLAASTDDTVLAISAVGWMLWFEAAKELNLNPPNPEKAGWLGWEEVTGSAGGNIFARVLGFAVDIWLREMLGADKENVGALDDDWDPNLNPSEARLPCCVIPNIANVDVATLDVTIFVVVVDCEVWEPKENEGSLSLKFEMLVFGWLSDAILVAPTSGLLGADIRGPSFFCDELLVVLTVACELLDVATGNSVGNKDAEVWDDVVNDNTVLFVATLLVSVVWFNGKGWGSDLLVAIEAVATTKKENSFKNNSHYSHKTRYIKLENWICSSVT